jgi:1-deoxy-D-xylulose-5-phosphate reductoisomerase
VSKPAQVLVYGSTGSVGVNALGVIRHLEGRLAVAGLAARSKLDELVAQIIEFKPQVAVIAKPASAEAFASARAKLKAAGVQTELLSGEAALTEVAEQADYDILLGAITGAAGLPANLAAARRGKRLAIANKESLVMAGAPLTALAAKHGAELLPVDSEHSAVWQCMASGRRHEVKRVVLTASGGPFRLTPAADLEHVTLRQTLKHPTWDMGPKISVDSATLFNKALEVIEARWLFDLCHDQISVVMHPQSIIHSMVEFADHSVIAQLGPTDMRIPIQIALMWPERLSSPVPPMDLSRAVSMTFEPVDTAKFPALALGFEVARAGGTAGAALNAANEIAVARFLAGEFGYTSIYRCVEAAYRRHRVAEAPSLGDIFAADTEVRAYAFEWRP